MKPKPVEIKIKVKAKGQPASIAGVIGKTLKSMAGPRRAK